MGGIKEIKQELKGIRITLERILEVISKKHGEESYEGKEGAEYKAAEEERMEEKESKKQAGRMKKGGEGE